MAYEVPIAGKHLVMEQDFQELCNKTGYIIIDLSYHHNANEVTANELRRDSSPVSLSVRLTPDMMIQRKNNSQYDSSYVELKTGNNKRVIQMEAYQLLQNKVLEKYVKTPCLYVYRGALSKEQMIACYASKIRVSKLVIPTAEKNHQVRPILEEFYQVPLEERKPIEGFSNDAFVEVEDISNWLPITEYIN